MKLLYTRLIILRAAKDVHRITVWYLYANTSIIYCYNERISSFSGFHFFFVTTIAARHPTNNRAIRRPNANAEPYNMLLLRRYNLVGGIQNIMQFLFPRGNCGGLCFRISIQHHRIVPIKRVGNSIACSARKFTIFFTRGSTRITMNSMWWYVFRKIKK